MLTCETTSSTSTKLLQQASQISIPVGDTSAANAANAEVSRLKDEAADVRRRCANLITSETKTRLKVLRDTHFAGHSRRQLTAEVSDSGCNLFMYLTGHRSQVRWASLHH